MEYVYMRKMLNLKIFSLKGKKTFSLWNDDLIALRRLVPVIDINERDKLSTRVTWSDRDDKENIVLFLKTANFVFIIIYSKKNVKGHKKIEFTLGN